MRTLFPAIKANRELTLQVSEQHRVYCAEYGNPDGVPVLLLHDGPGGNNQSLLSRWCDPQRYRILVMDQRGCGRSSPYGVLADNDSWALIRDMEQLRQELDIDRWLLFGNGWGAALALLFSIEHGNRVLGLMLHAPFLCRHEDFLWRYGPDGAAAHIFPDYYRRFLAPLGESASRDPLTGYQQLLCNGNDLEQLAAAKEWSLWRGELSHLVPPPDLQRHYSQTHDALALARLECHFYHQGCFWPPGYLLDNLYKINTLPCIIVHGRYDMLCPLKAAQTLAANWPGCQLHIVPGAGHALQEPGIVDGLIHGSEAMADWLFGDKH